MTTLCVFSVPEDDVGCPRSFTGRKYRQKSREFSFQFKQIFQTQFSLRTRTVNRDEAETILNLRLLFFLFDYLMSRRYQQVSSSGLSSNYAYSRRGQDLRDYWLPAHRWSKSQDKAAVWITLSVSEPRSFSPWSAYRTVRPWHFPRSSIVSHCQELKGYGLLGLRAREDFLLSRVTSKTDDCALRYLHAKLAVRKV